MEEVMTRSQIVAGVVMVMLLAANYIQAEVCRIVNGSFEYDGLIDDITKKEPNGWDVNMATDKFSGYIHRDWTTTGNYNLTFSSNWTTFAAGDMATVSQEVDLTEVNEVIFDIKLETDWLAWDPSKCTAVVMIDDDVVWDSTHLEPNEAGDPNQTYAVENKYRDGNLHKLSLGMRINTTGKIYQSYITHWDSIKCTLYCGGGGLLPADFDRNCYVDANDLKLIAELWLETIEPNDKCNLFHGDDSAGSGFINFPDFANFADLWDNSVSRLGTFANKWLQTVDTNDPDNLSHLDDVLDPKGIINFFDLAEFTNTWLGSSYIENP
jgi:hypothetical protein